MSRAKTAIRPLTTKTRPQRQPTAKAAPVAKTSLNTTPPEPARPPEPIVEVAPPQTTAPGGKLGLLITLLRRPEGAALAEMMTATGWQAHSVRGALSGAIKKKLGLTLASTAAQTGRVYRIVKGEAR